MKVLLLTVRDNYHVPLLLRDLCRQLVADHLRVVVSTRSAQLTPRQILRRYGWKYTFYKIVERLTHKFLSWRERMRRPGFDQRRFLNLSEVVEALSLDVRYTPDVNSPESVRTIADFQPDLILSVYFDQILRSSLLQLTPSPPLNLHPSMLPAYAGSSPTFWVLANGESQTGITIHEMTEQVDRGKIVHQQTVPIEPDDTQFSLYRRCTMAYLEPLLACIEACREGRAMPGSPVQNKAQPSYYSKVTKADIDRFLARGRRFIRWNEPVR